MKYPTKTQLIAAGLFFVVSFSFGVYSHNILVLTRDSTLKVLNPVPISVSNVPTESEEHKAKNAIKKEQDFINAVDMMATSIYEQRLRDNFKTQYEKYNVKYEVSVDRASSLFNAMLGDTNSKGHVESMKANGVINK